SPRRGRHLGAGCHGGSPEHHARGVAAPHVLPPIRTVTVGPGVPPGQPRVGAGRGLSPPARNCTDPGARSCVLLLPTEHATRAFPASRRSTGRTRVNDPAPPCCVVRCPRWWDGCDVRLAHYFSEGDERGPRRRGPLLPGQRACAASASARSASISPGTLSAP